MRECVRLGTSLIQISAHGLWCLVFGHEGGHLATKVLSNEVRILKFRTAYMCFNEGKSIGTRGACMSFDACERRILMHSVPFPRVGIWGAWGLVMSYFIVLLLFR